VLTADGTGYGTDGTIWGGELLSADYSGFKRIAHLQQIPLIGGDKAIKEPKRVVFAIFDALNICIPDLIDKKTADTLRIAIKNSFVTSSFGRILDALACYLNICTYETYDGEPAMKLERYLAAGEEKFEFDTDVKNNIIHTLPLFEQLHAYAKCNTLSERMKADLVHSFVKCILRKFIEIGTDYAHKNDIKYFGWTGGVSYNIPMTRMIEKFVSENGLKLLLHNNIPNGDGGISIGQNVIAGWRLK
jgi:hydrogenase maturation protein HypF